MVEGGSRRNHNEISREFETERCPTRKTPRRVLRYALTGILYLNVKTLVNKMFPGCSP